MATPGKTMREIHIDLESRSEVELKRVGSYKYWNHPSTELLCACIAVNDEPVQRVNLEEIPLDGDIYVAHNAEFECVGLEALGLSIPRNKWRCSMASCAYYNLPWALDAAAYVLGLEHQKDDEGKKLMLKMCKPLPVRQQKANGGQWLDSAELRDRLASYCEKDVETEREVYRTLGPLSDKEQAVWLKNLEVNLRGVLIDADLCRAAERAFENAKEKLDDLCEELYGHKLSQVAKVVETMNSQGANVEDCKAQTIKALIKERPDIEIATWRSEYAMTSPKKYSVALERLCEDGRVRGMFSYHGASTGRWTSGGIQLHNLPRGNFSEDWVDDELEVCCDYIKKWSATGDLVRNGYGSSSMDILRSCLRGMIVSGFAKSLEVGDLAQIEARVLAWLADEQDVLKVFTDGLDLYKQTASGIFGKPYSQITKSERFIGKVASLALGYQGGKGAFISMANNFGQVIDDETADDIKNKWRQSNRNIVGFWYAAQDAFKNATLYPGEQFETHRCLFVKERDWLCIYLPSGRPIRYFRPELVDGNITYFKSLNQQDKVVKGSVESYKGTRLGRVTTYGGSIVESITQAVARDILAEAFLAHPDVVAHVHDELICERYITDSDKLEDIMCEVPYWAKGLPLDADVWYGSRYRK